MKPTKSFLLYGLLWLTLFLSGCANSSTTPLGSNTSSNQDIIQTTSVDTSFPGLKRIIASESLLGYVAVVNPKLSKKGRFSMTQATVQNLTENRYQLEFQYQWEDASGFATGSPRPWQRFVLGPKEALNFKEMALVQDATQAIFTIRLIDDTLIEMDKQSQL